MEYLTREFPVAAGDLIFVFTDGLFNVTNAKSEPYGIMRLRDSIYRQAGTPLSELAQNVFTEIENFAEGRTFPEPATFWEDYRTRTDALRENE